MLWIGGDEVSQAATSSFSGVAIRATITDFGPTLLSKVLGLNETQESSLGLVFHFADKAGLPLLDLKDLRAVISHLTSDEGKDELKEMATAEAGTNGKVAEAKHKRKTYGRKVTIKDDEQLTLV